MHHLRCAPPDTYSEQSSACETSLPTQQFL
jgi:hypothetical protein